MEKVTMVERIKNLMHDKNISQVELAKLCKTTQSSLSPALSGKRKIGEKFGRNIASALGVSYNWLLYGEGKMLADDEALGHSVATVTDIYIKFNRRKIDEANRRVIDLLK